MLQRAAILVMATALCGAAQAKCSRPIVVPVSQIGKVMIINPATDEVSGVYPELLRERGAAIGCAFLFPAMPRVRAEAAVREGAGDLLVASPRSPQRDAWGDYVPMIGSEWVLITMRSDPPPASVEELMARPGIRLNAVRSYNFGPAYMAMMANLERLDKVEYVADPQTIVRKMAVGRVDYAYMPSNTFVGALDELGLRATLGPKIHYTHLSGIPVSTSGVYVSRKLPAGDAAQVTALLEQLSRENAVLERTRKYFTVAEMMSTFELPPSAASARNDGK